MKTQRNFGLSFLGNPSRFLLVGLISAVFLMGSFFIFNTAKAGKLTCESENDLGITPGPEIISVSFAGHAGTFTTTNSITIDLDGLTDSEIKKGGSITLDSDANVTLTASYGDNKLGYIELSGGTANSDSSGYTYTFTTNDLIYMATGSSGSDELKASEIASLFKNLKLNSVTLTITLEYDESCYDTTTYTLTIEDTTDPTITSMEYAGVDADSNLKIDFTDKDVYSSLDEGSIKVSENSTLSVTYGDIEISKYLDGDTPYSLGNIVDETFLNYISYSALEKIADDDGQITIPLTLTDLFGNEETYDVTLQLDVTAPTLTKSAGFEGDSTGGTIKYYFSEPVQLISQSTNEVTEYSADLLAIYEVKDGDYETAEDDITITSVSFGDDETTLTIKYKGNLEKTDDTIYVVDAWGYSITDLAGNRISENELSDALFTVEAVAPTMKSLVAYNTFDNIGKEIELDNGSLTVAQNLVTSSIEVTLSEPVTVVGDATVYIYITVNGTLYKYGTISQTTSNSDTVIITPISGNETAALLGDFIFTVPEDSIEDLAGNGNAETTFTLHVEDQTAPTINISGVSDNAVSIDDFESDNNRLSATLWTTNKSTLSHDLSFTNGISSESLKDKYYGLYLTDSNLNENDGTLSDYYTNRETSDPWLTYLQDAAKGTNPFAYIKVVDGTSLSLIDAAKHDISPNNDVSMEIPDDFPRGTYTLTGTVTDSAGIPTKVTFVLTIDGDREAPTGTISINGDDEYTNSKNVTLTIKVSDESSVTYSLANESGSNSSSGNASDSINWTLSDSDGLKTVTVTFTDEYGNESTASSTITLDIIAPALTTYTVSTSKISLNGDDNNESVSIDTKFSEEVAVEINILDSEGKEVENIYSSESVTDDPAVKYWNGKDVSDGTYTIQILATDLAGNELKDTTKTVIVDTTGPVISDISDITSEATSASGAVVTYTTPTATDSVDGSVSISCDYESGSTFKLGETTVTCSSTDSEYNSSTKTFTIKVVDTTAPVITVGDTINIYVDGSYDEMDGVSASDIVDGDVDVTADTTEVDTSKVGSYTITYSAIDEAGNEAIEVTRIINVQINPSSTGSVSLSTETDTESGTISGIIPTDTTLEASGSGVSAEITIPAGTTVTGSSSSWDGTIQLPVVIKTEVKPTADSGKSINKIYSIELGYGDVHLSLDKPVKIVFSNMSNSLVGWSQDGVFHYITSTCDSLTDPTLGEDEDCKIADGEDLVVWTRHLTTFTVYTQKTKSSVGGGGSSSSSKTTVVSTPTVTNDVVGQVLGEEIYKFSMFMKNGSKNNEVLELQKYLNTAGFDCGTADGIFGPMTKAAVIKLQVANGLVGDGIVGPLTREILNK